MTAVTITPIPAFHDNYIWLIAHAPSQQAVIVDPGESNSVLQMLQKTQLSLAGILITHHHYDHTNGIAKIIQQHPAPVYGPVNDHVPLCDHPLKKGDKIHFETMDLTFDILDIPGHTHGHIAFISQKQVFCGDTLFTAGCGRVFEGTYAQMFNSLKQLAALPEDTQIYCGHEYTQANLRFAATIEPNNSAIQARILATDQLRAANLPTVPALLCLEKQTNPFLRCAESSVIEAAEKHSGKQFSDNPIGVFTVIRQWKDSF